MAIVINGSGTVTGISVGGLPDGIVDSGTLATDSVTAAKLKDDAIAVGDLPAGSILQVVQGELSGSLEGSANFDIMNVNITPKQADSDMLISVYVQWSILSTNATTGDDWGIILNRATSAVLGESNNNYFISGGGVDAADWSAQGSNEYGVRCASKTDLDKGRSSGTSQINYKVSMYKAAGSSGKTIRFMRDGWGGSSAESQRSKCVIIVQEVAT